MSFACLAGNHAPNPNPVLNQGFAFARCTRCGRDMMRSHNAWRRAPKGFRIVWKRRPATKPDPAQLALDLSAPVRDPAAPIPAAPRRPRARLRAATDLAAAALRLAAWQVAASARGWLKPAPARPRRRTLRIAAR